MELRLYHNVLLFCSIAFLILLPSCNEVSKRNYVDELSGHKYGEIHNMGSHLLISIEDSENVSFDEIVNFVCCLQKKEEKRGRNIDLVSIYKYFCYIDEVNPTFLLMRITFNNYDNTAMKSISIFTDGNESIKNYNASSDCQCK
jgi:hypothetical protein